MKKLMCIAMVAAMLMGAAGSFAGEEPKGAVREKLVFVPPANNPAGRENSSMNEVRGSDNTGDPVLAQLSPDEATTTQAQPTLFWYLSTMTNDKVMMTLTREGDAEPMLETELKVKEVGIQRVSLAEQKIKLKPGEKYTWVIALLRNGKPKPLVRATIRCEDAPEGLLATLQRRSSGYERAKVYFRESYWYDGMAHLSAEIDANPNDKDLREQRASLLEQVNLRVVADFEMKALQGT